MPSSSNNDSIVRYFGVRQLEMRERSIQLRKSFIGKDAPGIEKAAVFQQYRKFGMCKQISSLLVGEKH
jgi:hypothetical protein